jgi:hypothetical protein
MPRLKHVEIDANVCIEKVLPVEGGFAGALNTDEDDSFHDLILHSRGLIVTVVKLSTISASDGPRNKRYLES